MSESVDVTVDAKTLQCPMPLLKAKQALNKMQSGQVLQILSTDAGSWRDFHSYTDQSKHALLKAEEADGVYSYWLRKG
ncbi:MAG: sulfurtransferase TusA family protein [Pseudomonadales bacterium]|nr:sulfurtransferase TusA family protein [Pseudomonadales bacterium]